MGYMGGYFPQYQMPGSVGQLLKGRPVSSVDEVRAAQVDFDGSVSYSPDLAHRKIYTKQIQMDGTASINTYSLEAIQEPQVAQYVSQQEFEELKAYVSTLGGMNEPAVNPADNQLASF